MTCPVCGRVVIGKPRRTLSTVIYVHELGKKPAQMYGCAVSTLEEKSK